MSSLKTTSLNKELELVVAEASAPPPPFNSTRLEERVEKQARAIEKQAGAINNNSNGLTNVNTKLNKFKNRQKICLVIFIIFGLGLAVFAVHLSFRIDDKDSANKNDDESVSTTGNRVSSGGDVKKGEKGDPGDPGAQGEPGHSPELIIEDGIMYSDNGKKIIDLYSYIKNITSEVAIFKAIKDSEKESEEDTEYHNLYQAPGSTYIGRSYHPRTDSHGPNLFVETYEKKKVFINPITDIRYKEPDFVAEYDQNFKSTAVASTEIFESTTEYKKSKASDIGLSGGYGGIFDASVSSGQRSAMNALSLEDTAVAQSILYQKTFEAKAEQNLLPFVKPEFTLAANNLPEFISPDDVRVVPTNLRGSSYSDSLIEDIIKKYNDFSDVWGDYFVTSVDLGGSITMLSEISGYSDLEKKYSKSVVKASVGGGWGPWSAKAGITNTVDRSNAEKEVKSNSKDTIFVTSGNGVGDLNDPKTVISNIAEWGPKEMQSHLDRSRKVPVVVAEKVLPIYFLMDDKTGESYGKFILYKYGTESESLNDITAKFNEETSKTKNALKAMEDNVITRIVDLTSHIPDKSNISITQCEWIEFSDMLGGIHDSTCPTGKIAQSLKLMHDKNVQYHVYGVRCCKISATIS